MRNLLSTPDESIFSGQANDNFELLKAWAGTTLAFAILQTGRENITTSFFVVNLFISGVVCGLAFVLHELAHRIVARSYGAEAHFVANNGWLVLSVLLSLAGVFIAAPGAVWHRGYLTNRQGGLIALAGPVTNMVLSVIFFLALSVVLLWRVPVPEWFATLCYTGFLLNAWIGLFNMIPAGPFDGAKVLNWSPLYFGITVAVGVLLTFVLKRSDVQQVLLHAALSFFRALGLL